MKGKLYLAAPAEELRESYLDFYNEWVASGEKLMPSTIDRDPEDFSGMIKKLKAEETGHHIREGWVPSSTLWLVNEEGRILGAASLRHELNGYLMNVGGHIGYGIRPSERRKGYATQMLGLALQKAKELGIDKALVTCDSLNIGSERTIRNNGGVEDVPYIEDEGKITKRFWIEIK
jgi:predicted acetyltransferase